MKRRAKKVRTIQVDGDTARVPLTKGYTAVIDSNDVHLVEGYNWYAQIKPTMVYARRNEYPNGKLKAIRMHRVIAEAKDGEQVDHVDHDGLNNRKSNLRICTAAENRRNSRISSLNKSGKKGCSWSKTKKRWEACIKVDGENVHLGFFDDIEKAHEAYRSASKRLHGEFGYAGAKTSSKPVSHDGDNGEEWAA